MEHATIAGNYYTITSKNGCSVTDSTGTLNETVEAGKQLTVQAPSDKLVLDDEQAIVLKSNFKNAPAALGLLGGGKEKLPPEYTRVEFLENVGSSFIDTGIVPTNEIGLSLTAFPTSDTDTIPFGSRNNDDTESRFYAVRPRRLRTGSVDRIVANGYGWGTWRIIEDELISGGAELIKKEKTYLNWLNNRKASSPNGEIELEPLPFKPECSMFLFAANINNSAQHYYIGRIWSAAVTVGTKLKANFIPALDPTGTPCMFDTVSKQPFRNDGTGQFIAGVKNASQLRTVLLKLPDRTEQETGTLTLSIPSEANTPEIQELLDTTEAQKNWELTIQERAAEVATYSLRRVRKMVWVRRTMSEYGGYVDDEGSRWMLEWCSAIYSPRGNDPALHGYEPFGSVEEAAEKWGLVPYIDPNSEELSTEA